MQVCVKISVDFGLYFIDLLLLLHSFIHTLDSVYIGLVTKRFYQLNEEHYNIKLLIDI